MSPRWVTVNGPIRNRCGTPTGYNQHQRYRSAPERTRLSRLLARAQSRAVTRLRHAHPEEWALLYAEERKRVLAEESSDED